MGKIAFIFPGQGAQSVGMGKDVYEHSAVGKEVYDRFDAIIGRKLTNVCFNGPEEDLKQTINTQPAILATSLALLEALKEKTDITPDFVAGHSLGEYGALYTAGVLSLDDTIKAIAKRAELMSQAKSGSMAAVLGLSQDVLEEIISGVDGVVSIANYNTPEQLVITGEEQAVAEVSKLASEKGAKRVIPLAVSGAFHSALMKPAGEEFALFVKDLKFNDASIPVVTNVDAKETTKGSDFEEKMPRQIYSSVYWTQIIQHMMSQGVDTMIEIGPGSVLMGLNRKISRDIKTYSVSNLEAVEKTVNELTLRV
ncbi:MAG TPA: ACP S-malonyltransferase [Candidatus Adamsella sp.]|nr:ACP S-malonyltransferase [Candidatus Adamsella sp.]